MCPITTRIRKKKGIIMKKLLFILFILLLTNNMFCLSENEVVKVLRSFLVQYILSGRILHADWACIFKSASNKHPNIQAL